MWLTVTPETATPGARTRALRGGQPGAAAWRVTGRRGLVVDVGAGQGLGGAVMEAFAEANPEGA